MTTTEAVRYEVADGIVTLTMDDPNQSANTMNETYRNAMEAAVDRLVKDIADNPDGIKGVIVASAKKTFFAGGDLKLMIQATPADAERLFAEVESIKATTSCSISPLAMVVSPMATISPAIPPCC